MQVACRSAPKSGHRAAENEDAARWSQSGGLLRACVADGATESAFAAQWAQVLADAFARSGQFDAAWPEWERRHAGRSADVPWYVAAKAEQGAHAAALGVAVEGRAWRAQARGDCNLFVLSRGEIARAWPFDSAGAFGTSPDLFVSNRPAPPAAQVEGALERGQSLLLATDAVAAHVLACPPGAATLPDALASDEAFADWLSDARSRGMRNDDATALLVRP
jgi:hypothetical protein